MASDERHATRPAPAPPTDRRRTGSRGLGAGLLRASRPRQWLKNLLVLAAPAAAGVLLDPAVLARTGVAFVCFCLAASGTYLVNDAFDAQADRGHPVKRHRPVASGTVPAGLARVLGGATVAAAVALGLTVGDGRLALVVGVYALLMQAYNLALKHVAVVELAVVSSGFVLRAIAGGVATDLPISTWFLIVTSFGSLFVIVGKRHAEHLTLGDAADDHRAALSQYPPGFLPYVGAVAASVAIIAYCLWSLLGVQAGQLRAGQLWFELSIVPFTLAVLRYALLAQKGLAGAPEDVFLSDRTIQVLGLLWAAAYAAGVYGR